jgi:serine/threonine-protein kinase
MEESELGGYELLRRLAVGGMAEVFLARSPFAARGIRRTVVLKRLLRDRRDDEEFVTMFFDEARLMSQLSHPNIAQVLDAGTDGPDHYLVMEYVRGVSLRELLAAISRTEWGALPEPEALAIMLSLAEALAYAHDARDEDGRALNIVHRDLTPSNVVVSYSGAVKLIDFGIAQGESRVYETATGVLKGTCGYMAPERLLADDAEVDRRVDVFALGVILYEACVGAHPFHAKNAAELYDLVVETRYRSPRSVRPSLSPGIAEIISVCLERRPEDRPPNMSLLAEHLRDELLAHGCHPLMSQVGHLVGTLFP